MTAATVTEVVIALVLAGALFLVWVFALVRLFTDTLSVSAKLAWFVVLLLLAPVAIPVYLVLRHRRHTGSQPA
jgi:hypothetical protein